MLIRVDNNSYKVENPPAFMRCLRGVLGLSQSELAKKCELSLVTIQKIEQGTNQGAVDTWARIARIVGADALEMSEYLIGTATELLNDVKGTIRLYYVISPIGKLYICNSDYFDEPDEGEPFIVVEADQAIAMLKNQIKELGS